ncbi:hypothetical protein HMSSN036_79840 [Paenibacillus macerans]|nr:hypothetical protein HMSSN036_79840 [Paenibacillus macerans]
MNNREMSRFLLGEGAMTTPADYNLSQTAGELEAAGFGVLERREYFSELRFKNVGAFVFSPNHRMGICRLFRGPLL